jgi:hypothetical protein
MRSFPSIRSKYCLEKSSTNLDIHSNKVQQIMQILDCLRKKIIVQHNKEFH